MNGVIDLVNLEPTTISRDLKGKYLCIYGLPKVGKTTFAVQAPKNLLLAFEKGYNALSGIKVQDINKWSDFKMVLRELEKEEVKEMYDTISIDTIGVMYDMCEQFICASYEVKNLADIPWGVGYTACSKEFDSCLRKIARLGYGLIIIAHVETKKDKIDEETAIERVAPAIPKRAYSIVNQLVDVIGYIGVDFDQDGKSTRILHTRSTPTIAAGSRFPHLPGKIMFGYNEFTEALVRAIEKSTVVDGAIVVDKHIPLVVEKRPFEETVKEGKALWAALIKESPENAEKILKIAEDIFCKPVKLSEIREDQQDLFELLLSDMRNL